MAEEESYPWHCTCGRLNGKKHLHCPVCKGHWSYGTPHSNAPKSPRAQQNAWNWDTGARRPSRRSKKQPLDRSESARRRKGKGRGKGVYKGQEQQQTSPFAAQAPAIPPWPNQETSTTSAQQPVPPSASTISHTELLAAVRKNYPDLSQAPEDIQKAVEKADKARAKALSADLNKASKQVGKAAKNMSTVRDARTAHRQNWLQHLQESGASWQKPRQLFKDQQKEYGDQLSQAQLELNAARRHLQNLNRQAAAAGAPTSADAGDIKSELDQDGGVAFEAEAQALVMQVQESLQQSIAAAQLEESTMEINSDDEEQTRLSKRPRSMEPFGGSGDATGLGHLPSSPKS